MRFLTAPLSGHGKTSKQIAPSHKRRVGHVLLGELARERVFPLTLFTTSIESRDDTS